MYKFINRLIPINLLITFGLILIISINFHKVKSFEITNNAYTAHNIEKNNNNNNHVNKNNDDDDDDDDFDGDIHYYNKSTEFLNPSTKESNFSNRKYPSRIKKVNNNDNNRYQEIKRRNSNDYDDDDGTVDFTNNDDNNDNDGDDGYGGNIDEMDKDDDDDYNRKPLSRQRRYLIFPEGSSLQVVFDQIIPVVDYTNYLILGITVSLAWELPSKKPTELFEDFKEQLNKGVYEQYNKDNKDEKQNNEKQDYKNYDSNYNSNLDYDFHHHPYQNNPYYTHKSDFHPPMNFNYYYKNHRNFIDRFDSPYHHQQHPIINHGNGYNNFKKSHPYTQYMWRNKNPYWNKISKKISFDNSKSSSGNLNRRPINSGNNGGYHHHHRNQNYMPKHRIYPVFGKRSVDYHKLTIEDKFDLYYHRTSRHELYLKIEKYLHTKGVNGTECVLKTICETGKKRHETEPGSFIGEIMRAIFTFPEYFQQVSHHKHRTYDEAYSYDGDCEIRYPLCIGSLWKDFIQE